MRNLIIAIILTTLALSACTNPPAPSVHTGIRDEVLADGASYEMRIAPGTLTVNDVTLSTYAYNNQIPGPQLRVRQGTSITVIARNELPEPTTIHWHGLRQDIKDDGVPGVSQDPIAPGGEHTYTLRFPDAGIFWYHPHIREDRQQDLGLAGTIIVEPADGSWPIVDREETLILDDRLLAERTGTAIAHGSTVANHALMGRYGNMMVVNGAPSIHYEVHAGERVRFFILNTANVRPFNVSFGTPMRIIGSDIGLAQEPETASSVIVAPAERYIVDVLFPVAGTYSIRNVNPWMKYTLGEIVVTEGKPSTAEMPLPTSDIAQFTPFFGQEPNLTLRIDVELENGMGHGMMGMHGTAIEWEDTMAMMNTATTSDDVHWFLEDIATGKRNMDIHPTYHVGDIITVRIINDRNGAHPMQHPIHLHGQRFLVESVDGVPPTQLAWKDTVLVPGGTTVDVLVELTNPGEWMIHCHIAEHLESGMMASILVADENGTVPRGITTQQDNTHT